MPMPVVYLIVSFLLLMAGFLGWMEWSTRRERSKSERVLQGLLDNPDAIREFQIVDQEILSIRVTMKDQTVVDLSDIESRVVDGWFARLLAGAPKADAWVAVSRMGTTRRAKADPIPASF